MVFVAHYFPRLKPQSQYGKTTKVTKTQEMGVLQILEADDINSEFSFWP